MKLHIQHAVLQKGYNFFNIYFNSNVICGEKDGMDDNRDVEYRDF